MRCLDDVPAPEPTPPLPDTPDGLPGSPHPPAVPPVLPPGEDDEDAAPPPVQLPGRPGLPERVVPGSAHSLGSR